MLSLCTGAVNLCCVGSRREVAPWWGMGGGGGGGGGSWTVGVSRWVGAGRLSVTTRLGREKRNRRGDGELLYSTPREEDCFGGEIQ
jgi:hypothetical protein